MTWVDVSDWIYSIPFRPLVSYLCWFYGDCVGGFLVLSPFATVRITTGLQEGKTVALFPDRKEVNSLLWNLFVTGSWVWVRLGH